MSDMPHMRPAKITRYSIPGELDQLPEGSFCEVIFENGEHILYVQKNPNSDHPLWEEVTGE
jgi:hypothetical protein